MTTEPGSTGRTAWTPRFVFLHGFTQTHHHWHDGAHRLARAVGPNATSVFVDLPGHGLSGRISDVSDDDGIDGIGQDLVRVAGPGTYIGYSMGGRCALIAAATGDPRIERLVLIGATPGISDVTERTRRRHLDAERATHLESVGVDRFLDEWLALPLFAGLPADEAALAQRRRNTTGGLAHSLRHHGTGSQTPLWEHLEEIRVPTLVIAGELDTKFAEIGARTAAALPDGTFRAIPGAGHAAHLERPDETMRSIADWLGQFS